MWEMTETLPFWNLLIKLSVLVPTNMTSLLLPILQVPYDSHHSKSTLALQLAAPDLN
jgi:hypothetical protein